MHSIRTLILIRVTICFLGQFLHSQRPQFVLACAGQILPGILAAHWQQQESKPHTLRGSAHQRIQLPKQFQHSHRLSNKIVLCHSNQLLLCCMILAHLPLSAFLMSLWQTGKGKLHFWYHLCRTVSPTEFPPIQKSESCRKHSSLSTLFVHSSLGHQCISQGERQNLPLPQRHFGGHAERFPGFPQGSAPRCARSGRAGPAALCCRLPPAQRPAAPAQGQELKTPRNNSPPELKGATDSFKEQGWMNAHSALAAWCAWRLTGQNQRTQKKFQNNQAFLLPLGISERYLPISASQKLSAQNIQSLQHL